MSSPSISPNPEIPQWETVFVVNLDIHIKNSTESDGKTKVKEVKFCEDGMSFLISLENTIRGTLDVTCQGAGCREVVARPAHGGILVKDSSNVIDTDSEVATLTTMPVFAF
ncbi:uncharacterized protein HD556DRAFT_1302709 [Suillus plorans]|uniref:Uncharacterized protein n=1 Tax=Suillus plorans TaxID=116603 RepID=A0A9P7E4B8_9AGAM|nr:uncharacterized protein HD556DRAFT_1302709 [Suillus plorans]KAG1810402.1 hypothetical protein HD556DRAFT_1302709 [Suillus plorans]